MSMNTVYVSQDEIEAHEAAMQRVIKDEKEQEAINSHKRRGLSIARQRVIR